MLWPRPNAPLITLSLACLALQPSADRPLRPCLRPSTIPSDHTLGAQFFTTYFGCGGPGSPLTHHAIRHDLQPFEPARDRSRLLLLRWFMPDCASPYRWPTAGMAIDLLQPHLPHTNLTTTQVRGSKRELQAWAMLGRREGGMRATTDPFVTLVSPTPSPCLAIKTALNNNKQAFPSVR